MQYLSDHASMFLQVGFTGHVLFIGATEKEIIPIIIN